MTPSRFGLSCAISTPFDNQGEIDVARLAAHAKNRLARGCDSITLFGTTGEGASIGLSARVRVVDALLTAGIAPTQLQTTIVASSIEDAADQAKLGLDAGMRGFLLTPPFYFRGQPDDAVFAWHAALVDKLKGRARDMFAYHLPSVTGMPLSIELIGRMKQAFPGIIVGVKDSGATWSYTEQLLKAHGDLMILVGDERSLAKAVQRGGSGAISGMTNIAPELLVGAAKFGQDDARIAPTVEAIVAHPVLAAIKTVIAHQLKDAAWTRMRPPLTGLDAAQTQTVLSAFDQALAG